MTKNLGKGSVKAFIGGSIEMPNWDDCAMTSSHTFAHMESLETEFPAYGSPENGENSGRGGWMTCMMIWEGREWSNEGQGQEIDDRCWGALNSLRIVRMGPKEEENWIYRPLLIVSILSNEVVSFEPNNNLQRIPKNIHNRASLISGKPLNPKNKSPIW